MSNNRLKSQETPFSKAILTIFYKKMVSTRQTRHLWVASDITISLFIIMCQSDSQFWPLLLPTATSLKLSSVEHPNFFTKDFRPCMRDTNWEFKLFFKLPLRKHLRLMNSTFVLAAGKYHQTFPNVHQIIEINSSRARKQKWETKKKKFEANSTQCSQAVTHPSTD